MDNNQALYSISQFSLVHGGGSSNPSWGEKKLSLFFLSLSMKFCSDHAKWKK
jgi:hypothetical protein